MKTFEQIALNKLKELEPATQREWSEALGYKSPQAFYHTFNKLRKSSQIIEVKNVKPRKYKINDREVGVSRSE